MKDEPAYPSGNDFTLGDYHTSGHSGITLRDYFAGQALCNIETPNNIYDDVSVRSAELAAKNCFLLADEMLKERGKMNPTRPYKNEMEKAEAEKILKSLTQDLDTVLIPIKYGEDVEDYIDYTLRDRIKECFLDDKKTG